MRFLVLAVCGVLGAAIAFSSWPQFDGRDIVGIAVILVGLALALRGFEEE